MSQRCFWRIDQTQVLSGDEIAVVLEDLRHRGRRSLNSRQNLVVFRLACCCGLRASEIAGLNVGDVRVGIPRPYLQIRKTVAKGGRQRRVPLWWDAGTLHDLERWKDARRDQGAGSGDPFVCCLRSGAAGGRLDRFNVRRRFIGACKCLGAERGSEVTTHHGRHSFVSHALAGGRTLAEVRDAAGHANISTTSLYTHVVTTDDSGVGDLFRFGGGHQ
jgi:integrase/recombinase XerD